MLSKIRNLQHKVTNWRYAHFAAGVERPNWYINPAYATLRQQLKVEGFYSQEGQDKWLVEKLFPGKENGTFVDIGAHDGVSFSNTYLLEQKGWNGIAVEPNPTVFNMLKENRKCIAVQGCIAPESGKQVFRAITGYSEMLSGLVNEYDSRHLDRIKTELCSRGGEYKDIEVNCYNINELLESYAIFDVDYLNLDVEGVELKILESIDYNRFHFSVIGVENNYRDYRIPQFLVRKGFRFHSIIGDEFYQQR